MDKPNKWKGDKKQAGSFSIQATPKPNIRPEGPKNIEPCLHCGQPHFITQCTSFKALRVKDRRSFIIFKGLCVNCFKPGHYGRDCPRPFTCSVDGCGQKHSKFLHFPARRNHDGRDATVDTTPLSQNLSLAPTPPSQASTVNITREQPLNQTSNFVQTRGGKLALPIVPARVRSLTSNHYVDTYAMLDPGTNSTYCTEALCASIGATSNVRHLELTTIAQKRVQIDSAITTLLVSHIDDIEPPRRISNVTVMPTLNIDLSSLSSQVELDRWPHLQDLSIPTIARDQVHLLIGQDCSDLLLPEEVRKGKPGEPFAIRTALGWAINGPVNPLGPDTQSSHFVCTQTPLERDLKSLWDLEDARSEEPGMSVTDRKVLDTWNNSVHLENGHYTLDIPFKARPPELPDNRHMALHRMHLLGKRLSKDPHLKERYILEMQTLFMKGYAEPVPDKEFNRSDGFVWYLPHHPVLSPKKPEKCRIVFDCAARCNGISLNDRVHQGPDLTNSLIGVLLRFRQDPVAFMADIEGMFHQVRVTPNDRDMLRFLWWANDDPKSDLLDYRMCTHLFGGIWSPSCANFALHQVVKDNMLKFDAVAQKTVKTNFYVDDCLKSVATVQEAINLMSQLQELLKCGGFRLTKWISNYRDAICSVPEVEQSPGLKSLDMNIDDLPCEKALGFLWNVEYDQLQFDVKAKDKPKTRRGLLSIVSSIYDPLGYVSPFVLPARLLFQHLCRLQKGWDDPLPRDIGDHWDQWLASLPALGEFEIPRCLKPPGKCIKTAQLHNFSDASEKGYGAVSYLRMICEDDEIYVNIVMAKTRLPPIKGSTIPRLELAAAMEAMKLDKFICRELELPRQDSVFWTDSTIVLWYLQNEGKRFQTYVANRVAKILDHTEPVQWRHVPTNQNPADDASREMTANDLLGNKRWIQGPSFLWMDESYWPKQPAFKCAELEEIVELKRTPIAQSSKIELDATNNFLSYFSSWFKLKKAVAWMLRLRQILQRKPHASGRITSQELESSEMAIIKYVQSSLLKADCRNQMRKLKPLRSSAGVLRVGGRLTHSEMDHESKHQLILPHTHNISRLIIEDCHLRAGHAGVERVLAETRRRYWILRGRKLIKRVLSRCVACRRSRGKLEIQLMADLPKARVTPHEPPFTWVGIDYFGPFYIRRGRSETKRYGCIFTCLTIRAVHIEVAHTLDTDSFINALQRFVARRGEPKEIRSDNGTNFTGAQAELRRVIRQWNQNRIHEHLLKQEINWVFNPPGASHMGGAWERLIRTIRSVLAGIVKQQTLDDEGLMTLLTVVEGIINNRPITKLSDDPRDDKPLTPSHLLMLHSGPTVPPGQFDSKDVHRRCLRQVQYLADVFWRRWILEYLPTLQERQKCLKPKSNLKNGDLVLMSQENTPRNSWPLGLIVDTHLGSDGLVRSVAVRTANGIFDRPVTKICLLEAAETD